MGIVGDGNDGVVVVSGFVQFGLFFDDFVFDELVGYCGLSVCQIVGIIYCQFDYWVCILLVVLLICSVVGFGSQWLYLFKDILVFKIVKWLFDIGILLYNIWVVVDYLCQCGVQDLVNIILFFDGIIVYECMLVEEVVDFLQGGQGVFGIVVLGVMWELMGVIVDFYGECVDGGELIVVFEDELVF